jgi:hypothetical protein
MATANSTTGLSAPFNQSIRFDDFADLADAYDALADLTYCHQPHSPVLTLLQSQNRQLRALVDQLNALGLLS